MAEGRCVIPDCHRLLTEDDDHELTVCRRCSLRIARKHRNLLIAEERLDFVSHLHKRVAAAKDRDLRNAGAIRALYAEHEQPPGTSFVYYVQIGDHVKIGYTSAVRQRLHGLRVPVDSLLALEPGGRIEEQARHERFAHLRVSRRWENFRPEADLVAHIDALRDAYGLPTWLRAPRRGRNGPVVVKRPGG